MHTGKLDLADPASIEAAIDVASTCAPFDIVVLASGILHSDSIQPEKTLRNLKYEAMSTVFSINTVGPAMLLSGFLPLMRSESKSAAAAISARVGSISDNQLGGWVSYRASKAALNMVVKTFAIEQKRTKPDCVVVALQPGTVDSALSAPFNSRTPSETLFTPETSARRLIEVVDRLQPSDTGGFFGWDGTAIDW